MNSTSSKLPSIVYLVGAGPSTADLITLKGARLLAQANVIVYDALVDEEIRQLFSHSAKLIYVGKRAGRHALSQEEINQILIDEARAGGGTIVRLKGGDPFVFGRGGEEMQALAKAGVAYEVVPGVTAGIAAPAYAGIPVTHRGLSRSVTLITAYTKDEGLPPLDWQAYARLDGTLVFYMGMRMLPQIASALIGAGMLPNREVAIISQGTRPSQIVVRTILQSLQPDAYDYDALSPGILLVGDVATFADSYTWFSRPTLSGLRILITRSEGQSSALEHFIQELGGESLVLPSIELRALELEPYRTTLLDKVDYPCIAFTSPNGVKYTLDYLQENHLLDKALGAGRVLATIGTATAEALQAYGYQPQLVASLHTAEGFAHELAEYMREQGLRGAVLHPTSELASPTFTNALSLEGFEVGQIAVYTNTPIPYTRDYIEGLFSEGIDWISFCSSSAVRNFMALVEQHHLAEQLKLTKLAVIGPTTEETLQSYGYKATVRPTSASMQSLAYAMASHFSNQ